MKNYKCLKLITWRKLLAFEDKTFYSNSNSTHLNIGVRIRFNCQGMCFLSNVFCFYHPLVILYRFLYGCYVILFVYKTIYCDCHDGPESRIELTQTSGRVMLFSNNFCSQNCFYIIWWDIVFNIFENLAHPQAKTFNFVVR